MKSNPEAAINVWQALAEELTGGVPDDSASCPESELRRNVIARLHAAKRSALCFSGGGIRSATFGLGVLQGLATHSCDKKENSKQGLLAEFDYLSTVSGGGYLGAWFSAWSARTSVEQVVRELASPPESDWEPEPHPLRRLRKFANYLNPKLGLFSADTWTLAATILRNLLLNWLVILPLVASVLVLPRIFYKLIAVVPDNPWSCLLPGSAGLLAIAVVYMVMDLPSAGDARFSQSAFLRFGLTPLILSALGFTLYWAWEGYLSTKPSGFIFYGVAIMASGVIFGLFFALWKQRTLRASWILNGSMFALFSGAAGGLFAYWMTWSFTDPATNFLYSERRYTWLAVPCLLGVVALSQGILTGISSSITGDEDREWFSRSTAWILIATVCYFGFTGVALMPPALARWLPSIHWQALFTAVAGAMASWLGNSSSTPATPEQEEKRAAAKSIVDTAIGWAPKLIMPVFLIALLALIATFNEKADSQLTIWLKTPPLWSRLPAFPHVHPAVVESLLAAMLAIPALILSRVIDANKFSLHAMYRNRLIRTFLGASNEKRAPNPFTGFDPKDNLPMTGLPVRPLHVINVTLNLVKGENLGWQQRKGESFTATRYRAGSCRLGYQPAKTYMGGTTVGGAIAVSGAAANPNMGYSSSPLLSVIMMLFNARLGVWLPNPGSPGRKCWTKAGPTFSVVPFIDEAFGLTTDTSAWVNLSDGGHFDNLGLYEMVLRRCATIVVVDGSADPCFHFDDLGNAIRKIYVDMGVTIDFPNGIAISKISSSSSRHAAIGSIKYSAVDGDVDDGTLIYIKTSLTGNEPEDVRNYAAQNPSFPHQPTSDQWFDESQFEAYRRLGYHVVEEIFRWKDERVSIPEFVERAKAYCAGGRADAAAR